MSSTLPLDHASAENTPRRKDNTLPPPDAASLSHDMKTPLGAIELYNDLLRNMEANHPERTAFHELIADQVHHLADLADCVGALPEKGAHSTKLRLEKTYLQRLLADTAALYRTMHGGNGYEFLLDAPDTLRPILADRNALCRVLNNILDNAVKYSRPHTICIRVYEARRPLKLFTVLEITDRGRGIARKHRRRLFEPYYRVDKGNPDGGSGLGLAIAREIIEAHGGHIEIESTPGTGSTFRVLLPITSPDQNESA